MIDTVYPDNQCSYAAPFIRMCMIASASSSIIHIRRLERPGSWPGRDDYDSDDAIYLTARDDDGSCLGSVRLLPTSGSRLMDGVLPDLRPEGVLRGKNIREISRLVTTMHGWTGCGCCQSIGCWRWRWSRSR